MSAILVHRSLRFFDEDEAQRSYAPSAPLGEPVSIRERVIRRIAAIADGIAAVGTVRRWDARALSTITWADGDVIVKAEDEISARDGHGAYGTIRNTCNVLVQVVIFPDADSADSTDETINAWLRLLKNAYAADPLLVADGVRLAVDSEVDQIPEPEMVDGSSAATVQISVTYDHDGDDDSTYGTAIAVLRE